jgi:hypothetical protein
VTNEVFYKEVQSVDIGYQELTNKIDESIEFKNDYFKVYEYLEDDVKYEDLKQVHQKLPPIPHEIREHMMKGFIYTFFLTFFGRFLSAYSKINFISLSISPLSYFGAAVFSYHYLKPIYYMYNSIVKIEVHKDGKKARFHFKNNLKTCMDVDINKIRKVKNENTFLECYNEPFLYEIVLDMSDKFSKYSIKNTKSLFIYGDSHTCIKHGEIFRSIINSKYIKF